MDFYFQIRSVNTPNYHFEVSSLDDTVAVSFEN